ncbi:hypothetical protein O3P69_008070 [Scylla paramamosain]|uniref:Secreted protein n=1 Tax=Scylla paramamosain TaxID=85552 RepID=A0AAW0T0W4_SCYPA
MFATKSDWTSKIYFTTFLAFTCTTTPTAPHQSPDTSRGAFRSFWLEHRKDLELEAPPHGAEQVRFKQQKSLFSVSFFYCEGKVPKRGILSPPSFSLLATTF